jgi:hypothetical protein
LSTDRTHVWLRAETKPLEQRTALTPAGARVLLEAGFEVTVEDSPQNIFPLDDYRAAGCSIAAPGSWKDAPGGAFVLGLKELDEDVFPLAHRHIYFAHVFKGQEGADDVLRRFVRGGGALYDLEYLALEDGRRVAAFGYWAGFAGAALGVMAWANKQAGQAPPLEPVQSLPSKDELLARVAAALRLCGTQPVVLIIGAKGRGGSGAVELARSLGLATLAWDIEETRGGGPFREIAQADVFVNCVLVNRELPPFVTRELLSADDRKLSVIADVSCDPYGPFNPIPVYEECTTFDDPCHEIVSGDRPLHLIAIDNLPSLLPRESSEDFGEQLVPVLATLDRPDTGVWKRAHDIFLDHSRHLKNT